MQIALSKATKYGCSGCELTKYIRLEGRWGWNPAWTPGTELSLPEGAFLCLEIFSRACCVPVEILGLGLKYSLILWKVCIFQIPSSSFAWAKYRPPSLVINELGSSQAIGGGHLNYFLINFPSPPSNRRSLYLIIMFPKTWVICIPWCFFLISTCHICYYLLNILKINNFKLKLAYTTKKFQFKSVTGRNQLP